MESHFTKRKSGNDQYVWICEKVINITNHQGKCWNTCPGRKEDNSWWREGWRFPRSWCSEAGHLCEIWSYFMLMTYKLLHVYYTSKKNCYVSVEELLQWGITVQSSEGDYSLQARYLGLLLSRGNLLVCEKVYMLSCTFTSLTEQRDHQRSSVWEQFLSLGGSWGVNLK